MNRERVVKMDRVKSSDTKSSERLVGVEELAYYLGVPKSWIYSRTRINELPCYQVGKYIKFRISEVMATLK